MTSIASQPPAVNPPARPPITASQSPTRRMLRRLLRHRSAQIGLVVLFFLTMVAVFADVIAPRGYEDQIETAGVKRRDPPCVRERCYGT